MRLFFFDRGVDIEQAGKKPFDISINDSIRLIEGNTHNGAGRVLKVGDQLDWQQRKGLFASAA